MHRGMGQSSTLVAYMSPPGHDHDDNCRVSVYMCSNNHRRSISIINRCYNDDCSWVGKTECHCSEKVEEWPE